MGTPDLAKLKAAADASAKALAAAEADAAALEKAKDTPRTEGVVLIDFMKLVAMRLGNRKDLQLLVTEFEAAVNPPPPESSDTAKLKAS